MTSKATEEGLEEINRCRLIYLECAQAINDINMHYKSKKEALIKIPVIPEVGNMRSMKSAIAKMSKLHHDIANSHCHSVDETDIKLLSKQLLAMIKYNELINENDEAMKIRKKIKKLFPHLGADESNKVKVHALLLKLVNDGHIAKDTSVILDYLFVIDGELSIEIMANL